MDFQPSDGHLHQYLNGECTWCGMPPPSDAPPGVLLIDEATEVPEEVSRELAAGIPDTLFTWPAVDEQVTETEFVRADPDTITEVTVSMAEMMLDARTFNVEGRDQTIMAFAIRPLEDAEIERFAGEAQKVLAWAQSLEITDHTSAKLVAGELQSITLLKRGVQARAKELMADITSVKKDMEQDLAKVTAPLAEADKISRDKVTEWDRKQRKIIADAEEATRKARESAEAARRVIDAGGEAPDLSAIEPVDIPAAPTALRPDSGGTVSMVDHWSAEVEDEDKMPREYMMPNQQKLNLEARQRKGTRPIPGVKWVNNPTPRVG